MFNFTKRRNRKTTPAKITATALTGTGLTVAALTATNIIAVPTWAQLSGVDVASHQHPSGSAIDWQQVRANGQKFAFIKATEGTSYTNPYFSTDSLKAQEAGIMPGSYHYARPGNNNPRAEARFYATTLATGPQPSLPPVLDLEEHGGLSRTELQNWVREWVDEIKIQTGRNPIIYTYYSFWIDRMGNTTEFSEYPLWLAYYNSSLPNTIPGGWDEVTFWQYSDSGDVPGIRTKVDMNTYYGDDATLNALAADMPSTSVAGAISKALTPLKEAATVEAGVANTIEHATGVDVPLTTDFLMLLLGVAGGRLPAETILTQGAAQVQQQGTAGAGDADTAGSSGVGGEGGDVSGSIASAQSVLKLVQALANGVNDFNSTGKELPVEMLLGMIGGGAESSPITAGTLLSLLSQYGGTQDWSVNLAADEVPADPFAYLNLANALLGVKATPEGQAAAAGLDLPHLFRALLPATAPAPATDAPAPEADPAAPGADAAPAGASEMAADVAEGLSSGKGLPNAAALIGAGAALAGADAETTDITALMSSLYNNNPGLGSYNPAVRPTP